MPSGAALKTTVRPFGSEERAKNRQRPKRQWLEGHVARPAGLTDASPREKRGKTHAEQKRGASRDEWPPRPPFVGRGHSRRRRSRHSREPLKVEGDVPGRLEAALGVLLQAVAHDPLEGG